MVTDDQYQAILVRLRRVENVMNDLLVALDKLVTVQQLVGYTTVAQAGIAALQEELAGLEQRVQNIEDDPT